MEKSVIVGDLVEIFGKPFTGDEHEGWAIVKKIYRRYNTHVDAEVEFDDELGTTYPRTIVLST